MKEGNVSDHTVIQTTDVSLLESMTKRLKAWSLDCSQEERCTIHRVPPHLRDGDKSAYQPKIISIGPYHHGDHGLEAMEEHKWQSLQEFLNPDRTDKLEHYLDKVRELEKEARSCYSEEILMGNDDFVQMMVLDCCFIIQLFLKRFKAKDDLIYSTRWMLPLITNDLLLLENQIPFFILRQLFQLVEPEIQDEEGLITIDSLAVQFFSHLFPENYENAPFEPLHFLHLLHFFHTRPLTDSPNSSLATGSNKLQPISSRLPPSLPQTNSANSDIEVQATEAESTKTGLLGKFKSNGLVIYFQKLIMSGRKPLVEAQKPIPCAVELHEAGVKFRAKKDANSYLEVTFQDGVMEIPYLLIKDTTNSLFRNFIAFEQCRPESKCHFTSYAFFMDCIVNTPADVALLGQHKILEHWLGNDEAVALLFNGLCYGVAMDTQTRHYFPKLFQDVRNYCETAWHMWRARLMHDYFSNPWAIVSVVAAIVLLLLTVAQTFLSIIAYVQPPA